MLALVPPMPKELTSARRGHVDGHGQTCWLTYNAERDKSIAGLRCAKVRCWWQHLMMQGERCFDDARHFRSGVEIVNLLFSAETTQNGTGVGPNTSLSARNSIGSPAPYRCRALPPIRYCRYQNRHGANWCGLPLIARSHSARYSRIFLLPSLLTAEPLITP